MGDLKRPLFPITRVRRPQRKSSKRWLSCHRCTDAFLGERSENFRPPERDLSNCDDIQDVERPGAIKSH